MRLDFLTPPVSRLAADGTVSLVYEGGLLGRLRQPVLLLARDLCAFSLFETAALPRGRRRQAARLHARTASPYVASLATLVKSGDDFGIWWWDLERVLPLVEAAVNGPRPALRPETMAQPAGSGWRIVKLAHGYEAQLWRGRGLAASVWSRTRFDAATWTAFTRLQRRAPPADPAPPLPEIVPIATDSEAFSLALLEVSRDQAAAMAAGGFACCVMTASVYLLGQSVSIQDQTEKVERETTSIRTATLRPAAVQSLEADRQRLATYRQIESRTNPVSAVGAAVGIVAIHDFTPTAVDAAEDVLSLTLPYAAMDEASELISDFEESGYFFDVQPRTDASNQTIIFEMKIRSGAPALSAVG